MHYGHIKLPGHISKLEFSNCPILSKTTVILIHLLWADDLILLSLDQKPAGHNSAEQAIELMPHTGDGELRFISLKHRL